MSCVCRSVYLVSDFPRPFSHQPCLSLLVLPIHFLTTETWIIFTFRHGLFYILWWYERVFCLLQLLLCVESCLLFQSVLSYYYFSICSVLTQIVYLMPDFLYSHGRLTTPGPWVSPAGSLSTTLWSPSRHYQETSVIVFAMSYRHVRCHCFGGVGRYVVVCGPQFISNLIRFENTAR